MRIAESTLAGFCHAVVCSTGFLLLSSQLSLAAILTAIAIFIGLLIVAGICWRLTDIESRQVPWPPVAIHVARGIGLGILISVFAYPVCILLTSIVIGTATSLGIQVFEFWDNRPQPGFTDMFLSILSFYVLMAVIVSLIFSIPANAIVATIISFVVDRRSKNGCDDLCRAATDARSSHNLHSRRVRLISVAVLLLIAGAACLVVREYRRQVVPQPVIEKEASIDELNP